MISAEQLFSILDKKERPLTETEQHLFLRSLADNDFEVLQIIFVLEQTYLSIRPIDVLETSVKINHSSTVSRSLSRLLEWGLVEKHSDRSYSILPIWREALRRL